MEIFDRPPLSENEYRMGPTAFRTIRNRKGNESDTVDLIGVLTKLWARKKLIFASVIICGGLAYVMAKLSTPSYVGTAVVLINAEPANSGLSDAIVRVGPPGTPEAITTEAFVLQSRSLASATIERLHLDRYPEFDPLLSKSNRFLSLFGPVLPLFDKVRHWPQELSALLFGVSTSITASDGTDDKVVVDNPATASKPSTAVVNAFLERLRVAAQEHSNVIEVSFSSSSPKTAALVPNTLIQVYLDQRSNGSQQTIAREKQRLDSIVLELRDKMNQSELALAGYRQKSGLVGEKNPMILGQDLTETKAQLALARAHTAEVTARLSQMQSLPLSSGQLASTAGTTSPASASESPALLRLREQEVKLEGELAATRVPLGPNHPKTLQLVAQLKDLGGEIRRETAGRLKAELAAAQATEVALNRKMVEFTHDFAQVNGGDSRLQTLIADAEADRKAYERYLTRADDVHSSIGHEDPGASLLSPADPPLKPSFPNTKLMVIAGITIGAAAGTVLVAAIDLLLGGLRSKEQVEDALGVKCLGLVPKFRPARLSRLRATELPKAIWASSLPKPRNAIFKQSVRSVEFKLLSSDRRGASRVVMVTSALPQEGKTWIAVSLAASLAADGFGVALVDCDLHRPTVHRMFNGAQGPGLSDYVVDGVEFDQIIHRDRSSGVDYVPVGTARSREAWLITLDRLRPLIDRLEEQYAFVILDSAPVLAVPETVVLSQMAHKTIFVVRWGRTPARIAGHAVTQLLEAGAETAAVLSMVDMKRAAKYGDPMAGMYKRLGGYYNN